MGYRSPAEKSQHPIRTATTVVLHWKMRTHIDRGAYFAVTLLDFLNREAILSVSPWLWLRKGGLGDLPAIIRLSTRNHELVIFILVSRFRACL